MNENAFGLVNYLVLGVYLAVMVSVGVVTAGRQKTTRDFFLAGRNMPWWAVAVSVFAIVMSCS
ncbi:MAG TPA: hypothetical protein PKL84_16935 [Candidatus Hydrogenedentes bacterium]|nr:hypothetical protein [Candidatus Hydrogenedentota bacterium]